ncbi:MAG TPA: pantetheine-phosphate adenylyltransferase [Elusimicrobiales bacterium]|nr:pantetheine-phosphate adenylyltransferase [Elusimicrobiales bacterium]
MKKKIAIYPGSFDPVTNGHIDIIKRAVGIFDEVIVSVLSNREKKPLFTTEERMEMIKEAVKAIANVSVGSFSGLLVDYMKKHNSNVAIRGLRAVSDLDYEFQIAHINRELYPEMETVFFMPNAKYVYLSSSIVREAASFGGDLSKHLPANVKQALEKKFAK